MKHGRCPMCQAAVPVVKKPKLYSLVYCPECDAELSVVGLAPLELDWPFEEIDDYQEEDDFVFMGKSSWEDEKEYDDPDDY